MAIKNGGLQVHLEELDPNSNSNFFENYFTPKSAKIQQRLQKPWEIQQQRHRLKHASIAMAAAHAEALLTRKFSSRDSTQTVLESAINFSRLEKATAFF